MSLPAGIETLDFSYDGRRAVGRFAPVLVGVVGSGNLEVLLEPGDPPGCRVHVETSARGFGSIWQAVLDDFQARHALAGVCILINDMGATPAVVSLRLDQAVAELAARTPPGNVFGVSAPRGGEPTWERPGVGSGAQP